MTGKVTLRLYQEELPEKQHAVKLVYVVKDTGIGMTEEFQRTMYSTFTREVKTQVNNTQGTGLGLYIVKQVVDMMQGTITCKSAQGEGTMFTVTLEVPLVDRNTEKKAMGANLPDMKGIRLLITEDNELNWEVASELLAERGILCDRAENGQESIDTLTKATAGTYAAILMDVHMPVMDGYEATKRIRALEDQEKRNIPIIAMTADAFAEDVQLCLACGMNGHIAKPIDMDRLIFTLANLLYQET